MIRSGRTVATAVARTTTTVITDKKKENKNDQNKKKKRINPRNECCISTRT